MKKAMTASVVLVALSVTAFAQQEKGVGTAQNDVMDSNTFGRMVMINTLKQVGTKSLKKGAPQNVDLPMTVQLSEKTSDGQTIQCVEICTVIGGVPICVCI